MPLTFVQTLSPPPPHTHTTHTHPRACVVVSPVPQTAFYNLAIVHLVNGEWLEAVNSLEVSGPHTHAHVVARQLASALC